MAIGLVTFGSRMETGNFTRALALSESDWARNIAGRKLTAYTVQLNWEPVVWCLLKKRYVAASSPDADYIFPVEHIHKVQYFHCTFRDLKGLREPTVIYEDSQPCILWNIKHGEQICTCM